MAPVIILVGPQMGENIGATARAMKNFGLHELRIVDPRDGWPNPKADAMSVGAIDIIESAKIFDNVTDAVSDLQYVYATTAQRRDMNKNYVMSRDIASHIDRSIKTGIMFGRENWGLTNKEIGMANTILTIDTDPDFSSLNIAHAVAVICSQLYISEALPGANNNTWNPKMCTKNELEYLFTHLFDELEKANFFKVPEKREQMQENIRGTFSRIEKLSKNEVQTLRGIISAITKK